MREQNRRPSPSGDGDPLEHAPEQGDHCASVAERQLVRPLRAISGSRGVRMLVAFVLGLLVLGWVEIGLASVPLVPMRYSTAVGFVITGLAVVAHLIGRRGAALWGGVFAAGIGSLALAEELVGHGFSFVAWMLPEVPQAPGPERMSSVTAMCFALSGCLLIVYQSSSMRRSFRQATAVVMATVIVAAGSAGLLGYVVRDASQHGFAQVTSMDASTALGFVVLGVAFFAMIGGLHNPARLQPLPRWSPWAIGGVVAALTLALWVNLTASDMKVSRLGQTRSHEAAVLYASTILNGHLSEMELVGRSLERASADEAETFAELSAGVEQGSMGALSVLLLDVDGDVVLSRTTDRRGGKPAADFESLREREALLKSCLDEGKPFVVDPVLRHGGRRSLWIGAPVTDGSLVSGVLAVEHDLASFLGQAFRSGMTRSQRVVVSTEFGVPFYDSRDSYGHPSRQSAPIGQGEYSLGRVAVGQKTWRVITSADLARLGASRGVANTLLLWFGLFLALCIAYVIRMSEGDRRRATSVQEARRRAEENADSLQRANQRLERHAEKLWDAYSTLEEQAEDLVVTHEKLEQKAEELLTAKAHLKRKTQEQRGVLDSLVAFVIGVDADGLIVEWNTVSEEVFGIQGAEVLGTTFDHLELSRDVSRLRDAVEACVREGERVRCDNLCVPVRPDDAGGAQEDDAERVVSFTVSPSEDGSGRRGFSVVGSDVTERQQLEVQLHHAQRLEVVGTLAAGIAHEINTPMQYVGDNLRFVAEQVGPVVEAIRSLQPAVEAARRAGLDPEVIAALEQAVSGVDVEFVADELPLALSETMEGVERVTTIVRAMKDFSHPGDDGRKEADLNRAIETTLAVARNEYKYVADIETDFGEIPLVACWVADLNQVVLNLLINAAHAIDEKVGDTGGRGTIKVQTRELEDEVEIRLTDSGCGIPEEAREKVFDQFFTTKEVGRGTGQGLAIAHSVIVEKHGGSLSFESESGHGTTFIIRLPVRAEEQEAHETANPDPVRR